MTFEVGKEYPTRGGGTATITRNDGTGIPFRVQHDGGRIRWHHCDGSFVGGKPEYDLIAPAVEPEAPAPAAKTLRDEFAMAALTGMMANSGWCDMLASGPAVKTNTALAYEYADAMLAARAKGGAA